MSNWAGGKRARTVLEAEIRSRQMTFEEFVEYAENFARDHGEAGTLSLRHLRRLAAGRQSDGRPLGPVRPATARLLERIFGLSIDELLSAPDADARSAESATDLRTMLNISGRVDLGVVSLLRGQLDYVRRLDRQLGAIVAHDEVLVKITQVDRLRSFSLTPAVRSALAALQSELCTLAGWQALDMGNQVEAWGHYERGKIAAHECHDPAFLGHTLAEQAFVLLDAGEPDEAVALLEPLADQYRRVVSPVLFAWLSAALGEAYAVKGDRSASLKAFDTASAALPEGEPDHEGPFVALDPTHLARWRGHALARLGEPGAVETLTKALDELDPSFIRAATSLRVDLATALLRQGEREEAHRHVVVAGSAADEIGSVRQRRRIAALGTATRPGRR
ncbi:hypothetical protein [Saccharothrix sp.]|uniref:hypothetical protein n=1 Tax=Saccharothrix sp. TaxID=1873460 RepID=UPI0028109F7D|nr:hypothetical protein [Saccharothrix sp.]